MRTVEFDAVEPGIDGAACGAAKVGDDAGQFVEPQGAWSRDVDKALAVDVSLGLGPDRRRTDRWLAVLEQVVRDAAAVPELDDVDATLGMDRVGDDPPARDLGLGVAARLVGVALRLRRNLCRFSDDQARSGAPE